MSRLTSRERLERFVATDPAPMGHGAVRAVLRCFHRPMTAREISRHLIEANYQWPLRHGFGLPGYDRVYGALSYMSRYQRVLRVAPHGPGEPVRWRLP